MVSLGGLQHLWSPGWAGIPALGYCTGFEDSASHWCLGLMLWFW